MKDRPAVKRAQPKSDNSTQSTAVLSQAAAPGTSLETTGQERYAILVTLVFLFLRFSFLHDFVTVHIGMNPYLLAIAGGFAYLALLNGQVWRTASESKLFWAWILFAGFIFVGVPFSFWPGGSWAVVSEFLKDNLLCLPLIAGYFTTWERLRRVFSTIALAGIVFIGLSLINPVSVGGRLGLAFTSTVGNPNDLAAHLLFVLPFMLYVALSKSHKFVFRILCLAGIGAGLLQILKTASRGGLLGLLVGLVIAFLIGNMKARSTLFLLGPIAGIALVTVLPPSTLLRLTSLSDQGSDGEATASFDARRLLLEKSINITLHHPILGVGAGQFSSYEGTMSDEEGRHHNNWQETHNTYTEVSSEAGIPAFILFMWGLGGTLFVFFRISRKARKMPNLRELALPAYILTAGISSFCACVFFLSFGYRPYFVVLTGIALALLKVAKNAEQPAAAEAVKSPPRLATAGVRPAGPGRTALAYRR